MTPSPAAVSPPSSEAFRTAHGVIPSQWITDLPFLLRSPIIFVYVELLRPGDDFIVQLRKLVLSVAASVSGCTVFVFLYNFFTIPQDYTSAGLVTAHFAPLLTTVVFVLCYSLQRFTGLDTGIVASLFVYGVAVVMLLSTLSFPDWPNTESMILVTVVAQLLRIPGLYPLMALATIFYVISAVNQTGYSRGEPDITLWIIPGAIMRGFTSRMIMQMVSLSSAFLVMAALQVQVLESDKLTRQAEASSLLALTVADHLGQYDTEAAADAVSEMASEGVAATELLTSLTVLIDNLNKYRPHLPNWLLPTTMAAKAGSREGSLKGGLEGAALRAEVASLKQHQSSDSVSVRSFGSTASRASLVKATPRTDQQWLRNGQPFQAFVTLASIRFAHTTDHKDQETTSNFVDSVHRIAGPTHAAVHCFVGDTLLLSWNAASRAVQSESKAARMVAKLLQHAASECWRLQGSIVSGKMRVQMAGGADGKLQQQALTVSSPWLDDRVTIMDQTARRLGAVLMDHPTKSGCGFVVKVRAAAAALDASTSGTPIRVAMYEILDEVHESGHDDEWMYVIERPQNDAADKRGLEILDAWAAGDDANVTSLCAFEDRSDLVSAVNQCLTTLRGQHPQH